MLASETMQKDGASLPRQVGEARVINPDQFDPNTPQTPGMCRLTAISQDLAGARQLWAGVMLAEPNTTSAVHHHGDQETVVYVSSGWAKLRWGKRLENEAELKRGDFLFIPPYLPHQEINPSPDQWCQWVVVRSSPEPIVVALTQSADGEYVEEGLDQEKVAR
jgi:uncharacterized RmlC-like cupin family protein